MSHYEYIWGLLSTYRIVRIGNHVVTHVMQISVQLRIDGQVRGLDQVSQDVDSSHFVQGDALSLRL